MSKTKSGDTSTIPVILDGGRTPFAKSYKTYSSFAAYELGAKAVSGLVAKSGIDVQDIEHLIFGTVIHDPQTANISREVLLSSGLPSHIPAHTVSLACISSNVAGMQMADMIRLKRIKCGLFGGVDTCSDPPIRLSPKLRQTLVKMSKFNGPADFLKNWQVFAAIRPKDFTPDIPKVVEFSNGKSMGQGAELLANLTGVSREEADFFAARSHTLAAKATQEGYLTKDLIPVYFPPKGQALTTDEGPRGDTTVEKLARLKPAFDKSFGICTAGNSSFLTDGASCVWMASLAYAEEKGLAPQAVVQDYVFRAGDALSEMLSGPALTIPVLLAKNKLTVDDIGVWEIHEAFASQVISNLSLMKDDSFAKNRLKLPKNIGTISMDLINTWGGSLSLGHPFGATGGRLLLTAARRLQVEKKRYAVVSGCAAGGHGSAILLENPEFI